MSALRRTSALLVAVLGLCLALRLEGLDARTLTHPECYVPRLDFREPFDSPAPRRTLFETVQRTIDDDNHPPFHLAFMYLWTGVFGTGLAEIRMPSVVFGLLGVLFTFLLARRTDGDRGALFAALLLSLNGLHVFWSQHVRIWVLVCGIAAATLWLLQRYLSAPSRGRALAYVLACALGLWTEYYFWVFFLGQVVYVLARARGSGLPHALRLQVTALLLSTPMAVFLWSHLTLRRQFVMPETQLPRLVEVAAGNGLLDLGMADGLLGSGGTVALHVAAGVGLVLLIVGALRSPGTAQDGTAPPPSRGIFPIAAGASALALVGMWGAGLGKPHWVGAAFAVVFGALVGALCLGRAWSILTTVLARVAATRLGQWLGRTMLARFAAMPLWRWLGRDLVATSFWVSFAVFAALSSVQPMLIARGLLILAPLATILLVRAVLSLRPRAVSIAAASVLVGLAAFSAHYGKTRPNSPSDFAALGDELAGLLLPGETIAVDNRWFAQPVLYYVDQDRNPATTPEVLEARLGDGERPERFTVAVFRKDDAKTDAAFAELDERFGRFGYQRGESTRVFGAAAVGFVRGR